MIEETLVAFLKTLSAVTTIVGTSNSARIRPDYFPQGGTLPAVMMEVDEDPQNDLSGAGGLVYAAVTLTSRAETKTAARALAEAIRVNGTDPGTGLAGYHGTAGGVTFDAVLESTATARTPKGEGSDAGWWDVVQEFVVSYHEVT